MGIPKIEGALKSQIAAELKRQLPGFYLLQYSTNGAPDREIVGAGRSTRWEVKHGTPDFLSPGDQELMCCRLAVADHCRYIIFQDIRGIQRTLIVRPRDVKERTSWLLDPETSWPGFDMKSLVRYIGGVHGV
jgi:hypothetical protein